MNSQSFLSDGSRSEAIWQCQRWAWEIDPAIFVGWLRKSSVDELYGEVPNCMVDPVLAPEMIQVFTNFTFVRGLSKNGWMLTVAHELGHVTLKHARFETTRDRQKEREADAWGAAWCRKNGYDPLAAIRELTQRFVDWGHDSFYADHPSMHSAVAELYWRIAEMEKS